MTRLHYILISFFGAASILGIATQNSGEFLVAYLGVIVLAVCGLFVWGGVKFVRYTQSRLDADMVVERLKVAALVLFFVVSPVAFILVLDVRDGGSRSFDADTQYDYLRR